MEGQESMKALFMPDARAENAWNGRSFPNQMMPNDVDHVHCPFVVANPLSQHLYELYTITSQMHYVVSLPEAKPQNHQRSYVAPLFHAMGTPNRER